MWITLYSVVGQQGMIGGAGEDYSGFFETFIFIIIFFYYYCWYYTYHHKPCLVAIIDYTHLARLAIVSF